MILIQYYNKKIKELGFSSVSEITRFLLTNLVNGNLSIGFSNQPSQNIEIEKMIIEGLKEYEEGKTQKLDFSRPLHEQILENA